MKDTTVNLDRLEYGNLASENEFLYAKECNMLERRIREDVCGNKRESHKKADDLNFQQLAYFIDGPRGSGKSTFLHALMDKLSSGFDAQRHLQYDERTFPLIENLGIIDPTQLGAGENFFIHILALIDSFIEDKSVNCRNSAYTSEESAGIRHIRELLEQIALGIRHVTNNKQPALERLDDSWFYESCKEKCISSVHLRSFFRELVASICELYHLDALAVGIDDADIDCKKSEQVLESIRKYMLGPQLIFVFAGDFILQQQVVRGMQMRNLGLASYQYDKDDLDGRNRMQLIGNMQEQYFLKLFPMSHRFSIPNLTWETVQHLTLSMKGKQLQCADFLQTVAKACVGNAQAFINAVLQLPKRTFFQVLKTWLNRQDFSSMEADYESIANGLYSMAKYSISKYEIDAQNVESGSLQAISQGVIRLTRTESNKVAAAALYPTSTEKGRVNMYLSSQVARFSKGLGGKLEYLLTTFTLLEALNPIYNESEYRYMRAEERMMAFLSCSAFMDYKQWGNRITAQLCRIAKSGTDSNVKQFSLGCIRVMQRSSYRGWRRMDGVLNELAGLTQVENQQEAYEAMCYYLAFSASISTVIMGRWNALCVSIFNLLGLMLQCIKALENADKDSSIIETLTQIITPPPAPAAEPKLFVRGEYSQETEPANDDGDNRASVPSTDSENIRQVAHEIFDWWNRYKPHDFVSRAYEYSACWQRFVSICAWRTDEISLKDNRFNGKKSAKSIDADASGDYHYVADTLQVYMNAFTSSVEENLGHELACFVQHFPLWNPLSPFADSKQYSAQRELVNQLYSGQGEPYKMSKNAHSIGGKHIPEPEEMRLLLEPLLRNILAGNVPPSVVEDVVNKRPARVSITVKRKPKSLLSVSDAQPTEQEQAAAPKRKRKKTTSEE